MVPSTEVKVPTVLAGTPVRCNLIGWCVPFFQCCPNLRHGPIRVWSCISSRCAWKKRVFCMFHHCESEKKTRGFYTSELLFDSSSTSGSHEARDSSVWSQVLEVHSTPTHHFQTSKRRSFSSKACGRAVFVSRRNLWPSAGANAAVVTAVWVKFILRTGTIRVADPLCIQQTSARRNHTLVGDLYGPRSFLLIVIYECWGTTGSTMVIIVHSSARHPTDNHCLPLHTSA